MKAILRRWLLDDSGQDLIEYLLLASFIAIASWVGLQLMETAINTTYQSWDKASQEIWEVPEPVAAGS
jgi:Flp pilus assembly pilin Flp